MYYSLVVMRVTSEGVTRRYLARLSSGLATLVWEPAYALVMPYLTAIKLRDKLRGVGIGIGIGIGLVYLSVNSESSRRITLDI